MEPFLKLFQAERPLAIFLYEKLKGLTVTIMEWFVKPKVLQENLSAFKLINLDLTKEENLLPLESINVGFGAKVILRKLTTAEKTVERQFRKAARALLVRMVKKLFEKCPLKYKMTRSISSL